MKSVLNVEVSCFKNYNTPSDPKQVNLLTWLNSRKYSEKVQEIRSLDSKPSRDLIKAKLPAITPSGIFSYRSQDHIIQHSGVIQIDIDGLETADIQIYKNELIKIKNLAYLGMSVSAKGLWGLIPVPADSNMHKKYFDALFKSFETFGIKLDDKPKNIASLRGYSFDPNAYFNHSAPVFNTAIVYPVEKVPNQPFVKKIDSNSKLVKWMINEIQGAPIGERHITRLKIARLAGGYIAGGLLDKNVEEELIDSYLSQYQNIDPIQVQKKEIKAIRSGITDGLKYPIYNLTKESLQWQQNQWQHAPFGEYTEEKKESSLDLEVSFDGYLEKLKAENGILINGFGYPAIWDCVDSNQHIDIKTKQAIEMISQKHELIAMFKKFDLIMC